MPDKIKNKSVRFKLLQTALVCLFLILATLAVYWQVQHHDFVNFDDDDYIYDNYQVQKGLTLESIVWAFTTMHASNWHPLTWLSHMLDYQLYGLNPGWHHLTNLLFHIANTLLLFFVFRKMTHRVWQSAFVAALFALHPCHVGSVAWASERKDMLSTFFWMLTMWSYIWYVEHPAIKRYFVVVSCFVLGLMSKPMLVTLPFVLLLLDYWPLNRLQIDPSDAIGSSQHKSIAFRLVWEKTPLFVLVVISGIITVYAQKHGGLVVSLDEIPFGARVTNTLVAYVKYIGKMIYPAKLAAIYPHPGTLPWWQVISACLLLISISYAVIKLVKQRPYLSVGWLWYLGTLVPVIGLVQVGNQAMADRYTYVPFTGLFIIIAWGLPEVTNNWKHSKKWLAGFAAVVLTVLMVATWKQVGHWKNSITLYEHNLKVATNHFVPHNSLGNALLKEGRIKEAIEHFLQALRIKPDYEEAYNNLGNALLKQGQTQEAIDYYLHALRIKPDYGEAHYNLAYVLDKQGRKQEAIDHYLQALQIRPDFTQAHNNLGIALEETGRRAEAVEHYLTALRINPRSIETHMNLGAALAELGRIDEAVIHFKKALVLKPQFPEAIYHLAKLSVSQGEYEKALSLYDKMITFLPDDPAGYYNIACIHARLNRPEESVAWLKKAVAKGLNDWEHIKTDKDLENIRDSLQYQKFVKGR